VARHFPAHGGAQRTAGTQPGGDLAIDVRCVPGLLRSARSVRVVRLLLSGGTIHGRLGTGSAVASQEAPPRTASRDSALSTPFTVKTREIMAQRRELV